jgi:hypothetical protein
MKRKVAVDFDLTICVSEHKDGVTYIIRDNEGAKEVVKKLIDSGNEVFIWTARDSKNMPEVNKWVKDSGLKFAGINEDPKATTDSRKLRFDILIDDKSLGCPLKYDRKINKDGEFENSGEPYVDWERVASYLKQEKYY